MLEVIVWVEFSLEKNRKITGMKAYINYNSNLVETRVIVIAGGLNRHHDHYSGLQYASVKMTFKWDTIVFRVLFHY